MCDHYVLLRVLLLFILCNDTIQLIVLIHGYYSSYFQSILPQFVTVGKRYTVGYHPRSQHLNVIE